MEEKAYKEWSDDKAKVNGSKGTDVDAAVAVVEQHKKAERSKNLDAAREKAKRSLEQRREATVVRSKRPRTCAQPADS